VTYPLVNPDYTPDGAAALVEDGNDDMSKGIRYLDAFPYLGHPFSGYEVPES
jgi:hypothetical protein